MTKIVIQTFHPLQEERKKLGQEPSVAEKKREEEERRITKENKIKRTEEVAKANEAEHKGFETFSQK